VNLPGDIRSDGRIAGAAVAASVVPGLLVETRSAA
jgi:hypothetical protein